MRLLFTDSHVLFAWEDLSEPTASAFDANLAALSPLKGITYQYT